MKLLHTALSLSPVMTALLIGVVPAAATTIDGGNINTGSQSTNNVIVIEDVEVTSQTISVINTTDNFNFTLETGDNTANQNTGDGTVKSGQIEVEIVEKNQPAPTEPVIITSQSATSNEAASGSVGISRFDPIVIINPDPTSVSLTNTNTGADSTNITDTTLSKKIAVSQTLVKNETENFVLNLKTGHNSADQNTGSGTVESGNINVLVKKETLPPPQPPKPTPTPSSPSQPSAHSIPSAPPTPSAPQPTPEQPITPPLLAQKLAELIPNQPLQIIAAVAQPAPQPATPAPAPAAKLPRAGAETPLIALLLSAGSFRTGQYLRQKRKELKYKDRGPW